MRLIEKSLTENLYTTLKESATSNSYVIQYWESENDRDQGYADYYYLDDVKTEEEAIAKTKKYFYDNSWASCELFRDADAEYPIFGCYPDEGEVRYDDNGREIKESVTVIAGDTFVSSDETGTVVDVNGTTITVNGTASVSVDNEVETGMDVPMEEPIEEIPTEETPVEVSEEPTETEEDGESEEIIEPSEELIEPEEDEEELEESVEEVNNSKVTSEDLNSEGVNYSVSYGDDNYYVTCFWSSNEVNQEDIPEGDNLDDYGAINFDIYNKDGESVDGGLMITKEDEFDPDQLCKDLMGLCGYSEDEFTSIKREPNGYYAEVFGLEENLKENAGDPNSRVEIYRNPEFDYSILDVTELDNTDVGDVRAIDMFSILNDLEESLTEKYGTEKWGLMNTFLTRQGKHKKTNESYASAILDINIPKNGLKEELNTILTVEVFGDRVIKECVVKEARTNKKIERFCGKTPNPVKFLESVFVDLINNRETKDICKYKPMTEDTNLKEELSDEAYIIAEYIDKHCGDRLQDGVNGERILRRDDFDEEFAFGVREAFDLDQDADPYEYLESKGKDAWDLEVNVRSILGYDGYETIYETDEDRNVNEGDLVLAGAVNEEVEILMNKPYEDKGMNFADGKAIDKDVKRQERHLKQHKALGKTNKKFKVEKEPDQKNTAGKKIEDIQDTVDVKEDGKKKSPSKKKKVEESMDEEADRIMLNPVENFDFTDPYADYYEDENGNLYKSVDNGNELYICTKAGEPLKDVDPSKYILGDKALNEYEDYDDYKKYKKFKHVNDVWKYLEGSTSEEDLCDRIDDVDPKKYGSIYYDLHKDNKGATVVMDYSDDNEDYYEKVDVYFDELNESKKPIKEAKGLLDDEDEVEDTSEELVDVDDELEEDATEVAIFHRKPKSVEAMRQAEANGITVNKSNYKVVSTKEMSGEEFDKFTKNLYPQEYDWLKDLYDSSDASGMFKCIEVKNKDDNTFSILVDPGESSSVKYAAIKEDLEETPTEEPIEDTEEEVIE